VAEHACARAGQPFAPELPRYAQDALRPLLAVWARCGASERRLREEAGARELLAAVRAPLHKPL
jgi:hypothetical protein